jgi:hypothetical protein
MAARAVPIGLELSCQYTRLSALRTAGLRPEGILFESQRVLLPRYPVCHALGLEIDMMKLL